MPRSRQRSTEKPVAYTYGSAEKLNAPTTETATRMTDEQISEQPIPDTEGEDRIRIPRLQWNRSELTDHARTFGPLYVHDKVSPSEFVGTLLQQNAQTDMFADFNGFKNEDGSPADDVAWYPTNTAGIGPTVSSAQLRNEPWPACCTKTRSAAKSTWFTWTAVRH